MYKLTCNITIGEYHFSRVNNVKIESSRLQLNDSCELTLPTSAVIKQENQYTAIETAKAIKEGDKVVVNLGYNDRENEEFVGYVRRINYTTPLTVDCDDAAFFLRKTTINRSWKDTTLDEVLTDILADTPVSLMGEVPELNFTTFYVRNLNAAQALQKFIDEYGLIMHCDGEELYVGLADRELGTAKYKIGYNVIKPDIKYRTAEDIRLKIKAVHVLPDNTRTEVEVGDEDGELRTFFFYDVESAEQLKKLADRKLADAKVEGYDGNITSFLFPFCRHSYVADITDEDYPDRTGSYTVDKVVTTFGVNGGRRSVELGYKLE